MAIAVVTETNNARLASQTGVSIERRSAYGNSELYAARLLFV